MKRVALLICLVSVTGLTSKFASPPQADISNGLIKAQLYLPDAQIGYYRGSRFDWSGVVASLDWSGHHYFGQWYKEYNPTLHDAIPGPVEGFDPIGYDLAKPGEVFVKIGIGTVTRLDDTPVTFSKYYPVVDPGKWTIQKAADQISFLHTLNSKVCSYEYKKTVALTANKPQMVISHTLKNTGQAVIESSVFNHNFFVMDSQPTGTGFTITFPFSYVIPSGNEMEVLVEFKGNRMTYKKDLGEKEHVLLRDMTAGKAVDYDFQIENHKTGAAVKITGDQPVVKTVYWSASTTVCPEPYIKVHVDPGQEFSWKITYDLYECGR